MQLASAADDIKLWDCNGFVLNKKFSPHSKNVNSIGWAHDNTVIVTASTGGDKIVLTYPDSSDFTYSIAEKENIVCADFNTTSRYVLGGTSSGAVQVWDLKKSNSLKRSYNGHKKGITTAHFNFNDTVIASGSESGEIILFNVVTGIGSNPMTFTNSQAVKMLQYSHFKKSLFGSCTDSGAVCLWDANKRQLVNSFKSHTAPVMGLSFSPLNEMLLISAGLDKRIVCYDLQGKKPIKTMIAESPLTSIDILHDGATLAVGTTRGKIYIYDLRKGAEPIKTITAHSGAVQALKFQYKISKDTAGKSKSSSLGSMKKSSSVTSLNNADHKKSVINNRPRSIGNQNGIPDMKSTISKDPYLKINKSAEAADVFSPIKEGSESPLTHGAEGAGISSQVISSREYVSDAVFSPLSHNNSRDTETNDHSHHLASHDTGRRSHVADSSQVRGQPVGGSENSNTHTTIEGIHFPAAHHNSQPSTNDHYIPAPKEIHVSPSSPHPAITNPHTNRGLPPHITTPSSLPSYTASQVDNHPSNILSTTQKELVNTRQTSVPSVLEPPSLHSASSRKTGSDYNVQSMHPSSSSSSSSKQQMIVTPPDAEPSGGAVGGAVVDTCDSISHNIPPLSSSSYNQSHHQQQASFEFQTRFVKTIVEDALEDFKDEVRQYQLNLHMEMIKQFQKQQEYITEQLQRFSVNPALLQEIERLKEENNRLKKTY